MKMNLRKIVSLFLAIVFVFSTLALSASAFAWDDVPKDVAYASNAAKKNSDIKEDSTFVWPGAFNNGKFYQNMSRIPLTGDGARDAIAIAASQIGYLEGNNAAAETGTVGGSGNYTEYGAYTGADAAAWCASFCSWVMYASDNAPDRAWVDYDNNFGPSENMARNGCCWGEIYVPNWSQMLYYSESYRFNDYYISWDGYFNPAGYKPKTGDLIFFTYYQTPLDEDHIGIVVYSDDTYVYTIEGNTSSQEGLVSEGGGVFFKKYERSSDGIAGYGILPYDTVSDLPEIDYSGANPTTGLYVTPSGSVSVYLNRDDTTPSWTLPMSSIFEVKEIEQTNQGQTRLYSKCEIDGETVYGWIPLGGANSGSARTLQIYATPDTMPDHSDVLKFYNASLTITDDIAVNYKVSSNLLNQNSYTNPYVVFEMNGVETTVTDYDVDGDFIVFDLENIAPHQMCDTITATLYATKDDVVCLGETYEYSIKTYCYNILNNANYNTNTKLRTLIVDLLNYGATSQKYMKYKVASYVNSELTSTQKSWATQNDRVLNSVLDIDYETVANPSVTWKAAGLNLKQSVGMRFRFEADSLDGLTVKVRSGENEWVLDSDNFETNSYGNYVFFEEMSVAQMSDTVYVTAYKGNTPVSNTLRYSIESYAYAQLDHEDDKLVELVKAMMRYGDAAKAYVE